MADILLSIIKVSTFLGTTSFITAIFCPYLGAYFEDKEEDFIYMANTYIYWSLILILIHIMETKL